MGRMSGLYKYLTCSNCNEAILDEPNQYGEYYCSKCGHEGNTSS